MTLFMDSLIWRYLQLRRPGVPVMYKNCAMPEISGKGELIAPEGDETEDAAHLCFWKSEHGDRHFEVPWVLEIDLSHPEGRAAMIQALLDLGVEVDKEISEGDLRDFAWFHAPNPDEDEE